MKIQKFEFNDIYVKQILTYANVSCVVYYKDSTTIKLFPLSTMNGNKDWSTQNNFCTNYYRSAPKVIPKQLVNETIDTIELERILFSINLSKVLSSMPSIADFNTIVSATGMTGKELANGENFWLSDYDSQASHNHFVIDDGGNVGHYYSSEATTRPLITLVK